MSRRGDRAHSVPSRTCAGCSHRSSIYPERLARFDQDFHPLALFPVETGHPGLLGTVEVGIHAGLVQQKHGGGTANDSALPSRARLSRPRRQTYDPRSQSNAAAQARGKGWRIGAPLRIPARPQALSSGRRSLRGEGSRHAPAWRQARIPVSADETAAGCRTSCSRT